MNLPAICRTTYLFPELIFCLPAGRDDIGDSPPIGGRCIQNKHDEKRNNKSWLLDLLLEFFEFLLGGLTAFSY